jgi:hypothetical protein
VEVLCFNAARKSKYFKFLREYIMIKPKEAYADIIRDTFELIQFRRFDPIVMGSNATSKFQYAHDYDLFTVVDTNTDLNTLKKMFVKGMKQMFSALKKQKNDVYFIEFMCGAVDEKPLYWKPKDIKKGFITHSGKQYYLFDVLNEKSVIKIEIVKYVDGSFIPLSNVYEFRIKHKGVNREKETRDDIDSLKADIKKYHEKGNIMKVLKRLYIIAIETKDKKLAEDLETLFNSNIGGMYRIKSELETMNDVLTHSQNGTKLTIERCSKAIQRLKEQMSKLNENFTAKFYTQFDKASAKTGVKSMKTALDKLIDAIDKMVQKRTKTYMNDRTLNKINYEKYLEQ